MARGGKEKEKHGETEANPEAEERKRLRKMAVSKNLLSEAPAKGSSVALSPSKTVVKHHGKDIIRKSNRKNRFLFSFPGLLAPISGGKIGELKNLGSKNPILYLDFPQGQMKLFGTIVYPKNRYLTLQFSRGGKNVMCEDYFDTMVVFSDAWWIGHKEENPEEVRLDFPDDLNMGQQNEYDFKGGAGSTSERMQGVKSREITAVTHQSPVHEVEGDSSDSQNDLKDLIQATPTRHSARNAGKSFKMQGVKSREITAVTHHSPVHEVEGDSSDSQNDLKDLIQATPTRHSARNAGKSFKFQESSPDDAFDVDSETSDRVENEIGEGGSISKVATLGTKVSEELPESGVSATKMKDGSCSNRSSLVQTTISTLFKRKEEKVRRQTTKKQPEDSSDEDWEA